MNRKKTKNRRDKNYYALWMIRLGFVIFVLLFWVPFGFYLGGDPYFLGKYTPGLLLFFPYSGLGLFLVFLGSVLKGNAKYVTENQILFFLLFLAGFGVLSNFSRAPNLSVLFLVLWAIGFFASVFEDTFSLRESWKRWIILWGIVSGFVFHHYFPHWAISYDLLAIMAFWCALSFRNYSKSDFRWVFILLCFVFIFLSQNKALIIFTLVFWVFLNQIARCRKQNKNWTIRWLPVLFLIILWLGVGIIEHGKNDLSASFIPMFRDGKHFLFGVGDGQFLTALYDYAPYYIVSDFPDTPRYGMMLTFYQQGIVGLILVFLLGCVGIFLSPKNLSPYLFLIFWWLSSDFLGTPNGILLAMVLLFTQNKFRKCR